MLEYILVAFLVLMSLFWHGKYRDMKASMEYWQKAALDAERQLIDR